jgi:minor extracellular serine protease Vpr
MGNPHSQVFVPIAMNPRMVMRTIRCTMLSLTLWLASSALAQVAPNRYALILEDPPVSTRFASKAAARTAAAESYHQQVEAKQRTLRDELTARKIQNVGSVTTLMNAVFVLAPPDRLAELKGLPGVKAVVPMRRYRRNLNRATELVNAPAAWNLSGGVQNAGSGIKIGILDSGIDQTHPAFQDSSLPMPPGYPICSGSDCAFTNNKIIVARSYTRQLAAGTSAANPAADSRPDDYSPRDRDGHGTAVASCAAGVTNTGLVTITGMAPKAYLGNYKIYGSPEVNDSTSEDVIIHALEDAFNDGMDIVSFSSGGPAFSGPLDSGSACGNAPGVPCDFSAQAFQNAADAGLIVVAAAGNEGEDGEQYPSFNTIESPGDAPGVIAAGASTNSHLFVETVRVTGPGVPSNLETLTALLGDSFVPFGSVAAPLRDVTRLGDNGLACSSLPAASLTAAFALVERGSCSFTTKLVNALSAGAIGVVFYMSDSSPLIAPGGLAGYGVPAVMISNGDGLALKSFIDANLDHPVTIDPNGIEQNLSTFNQLAAFSSFGPSTGDSAVKPDLVAVGTSMYMAAQSYDPLGALYSSSRYSAASGTSFATPLVSGAAALVKQKHSSFTAAQVKSALVNSASQDVTTDDSGNPVNVQWLGAGKLDAGAAVSAVLTANPATVSFGILGSGTLPATRQITIANGGASAVTLSLAVAPGNKSPGTTLTLDQQNLTLAPGISGSVSLRLSGSVPNPGSYSGAVTIQSPGVSLRVPYLYLVGSGVPANIVPLSGQFFDGTVGQGIPEGILSFKLLDAYGVPVVGAPVSFVPRLGGSIQGADSATDAHGIAAAQPLLGMAPGNYSFIAVAGGLSITFSGTARLAPAIASGGIINGASFDGSQPVAPGSYISIFGTSLSDTSGATSTARLPLAIDYVNVSFDVPAAGLSVPGHLVFVSPNQVNVQVPWELQGQTAAQVKVTIDFSNGNVVTLPLADFSPAYFELGKGVAAALDSNNQVIGASNPARRGQSIQLFANGLGPTTNQPASGDPAPAAPLAETTTIPVVTIGGQQAVVSFSGLAPGFAGLYQVNVTVPENLSPGVQPINISIGGRTSRESGIAVQ